MANSFASREWFIDLVKKALKNYNPITLFGSTTWTATNYTSDPEVTTGINMWSYYDSYIDVLPTTSPLRSNSIYSSLINLDAYNKIVISCYVNGGDLQDITVDISNITGDYYLVFGTRTTEAGEDAHGLFSVTKSLENYYSTGVAKIDIGQVTTWKIILLKLTI